MSANKKKKPVYAGLSITHQFMELAVFSPQNMSITHSASVALPVGLIEPERDTVTDPAMLKALLVELLRQVPLKPPELHLSLPGTLLRMVEMPKIDTSALYLSLSSEAERYRMFDNTEAAVGFRVLENAKVPSNMLQLVLGAVRSDTLEHYLRIFKELKVKVSTVTLEPISVLRGMASTGVLDGLVQQIGADACWGMIFVEPARVRFSLWSCDQLLELRELAMDTSQFANPEQNPLVVEDLLEEIRRTTKNVQPALWLTYQMPSSMEQIMSQHLGLPVRSAPMGNAIALKQPLQLSSMGCTMVSVVPFPLDMDLLEGSKALSSTKAAISSGSDAAEEVEGSSNGLIMAGVGSLVLSGLATAVLFLMSTMVSQQIPDLQSKVDSAKVEISGLEARQRELKKKAELDETLLKAVQLAKVRNHAYVAMTEDLKKKTPERVWIEQMKMDNNVEVDGKALNPKSVIRFARSFDAAPYTKAILIDSIKEAKLGENLIYDFKISGGVNLENFLAGNPVPGVTGGDNPASNTPLPKAGE